MQERARRTRNRLVEAMRQAIHRRGVARTSIAEVLAATGVKKGSLYFHFADKDELALAALERAGEGFNELVDENLEGTTPGEQLRSFLDAVRAMHRETGFTRGCIFGNTALEMADEDPRYARLLRRVFAGWADRLTGVIAAAQERGEVRGELPPEALARQVVVAVEGGVMQARLWRSEEPLEEALTTLERLLIPASSPVAEVRGSGTHA